MKISKKRADELLFSLGLAQSRSQAQALIMAGGIKGTNPHDGREKEVRKAGELWPEDASFTLAAKPRFVSRGGHKLEGALKDFGLDPSGWKVLDLGASTGGFTDCLLQWGAAKVTAVDVGRNLIAGSLRQDERVTVIEGVNARYLTESLAEKDFDLAVMDLSFISLELILPQAAGFVKAESGLLLAMVKPQFEVGRAKVGKKGVVRDQEAIDAAVDKIAALGPQLTPPFGEIGRAQSQLPGPEGNREVFILFAR